MLKTADGWSRLILCKGLNMIEDRESFSLANQLSITIAQRSRSELDMGQRQQSYLWRVEHWMASQKYFRAIE